MIQNKISNFQRSVNKSGPASNGTCIKINNSHDTLVLTVRDPTYWKLSLIVYNPPSLLYMVKEIKNTI